MMSVLGWVLFGFIVGLIARAIVPGRDPLGLFGTTILGIVGAVAAGWFGQAVGWYGPGQGAGFISATAGAVALLLIYNFGIRPRLTRRKALRSTSGQKEDDTTGMAA
jgi:uncharacterized membrane protein YeaQ/YmgE (transglycosylase-associated protein family)